MSDTDTATRAVRQRAVLLARQQIGCHYVWGAAGARPGRPDGAWYRQRAVLLHENDDGGNRRDHGRTQPMMYAAWCRVDGNKVCAGRCDDLIVSILPIGDPNNPMHLIDADRYRWARPSGLINSSRVVYGEDCATIRHFDCIGFVNWILSQVVTNVHRSIQGWRNNTRSVRFRDVWAGDILTKSGHIGMAAGPDTVIHASSTRRGVVEGMISDGNWRRCGRLSSRFWARGLSRVVSYGPHGAAVYEDSLDELLGTGRQLTG